MPFYDLHCPKCDKEFNISASIADKTAKRIKCPECGSTDLKAVYNGAPAYIAGLRSSKSVKTAECPNRHICGDGCCHTG